MKRCICLLIVMMLLGAFCLAEGVDLSAMTADELIDLRKQITEELAVRMENSTNATFYPGLYVTGTDIAAGAYVLTGTDANNKSKIYLYESMDKYQSMNSYDYNYLDMDEKMQINLSDGMVVEVYDVPCNIEQAVAFPFAP